MRTGRTRSRISARWRLAIAVLVAFSGLIVFSFSGLVLSGYRLNQQAEALRQEIRELKVEDEQLQKDATYLESDEGLETLAREQLGWVKPGEVAVITIPSKTEERETAGPVEPRMRERPYWQRWWDMFFGR
jgi:cell division protein FtsB